MNDILVLTGTAASIGFIHTLLGPDHYIPFAALARARDWSTAKTVGVTALCGLGHVLGSVILGAIGLIFGIAVLKLESLESLRGGIAAWALMAFGCAYFAWGLTRAIRNRPHSHGHGHGDGRKHEHAHDHHQEHLHPHSGEKSTATPWILFAIFVFGPCEPLIPILMYPAATRSIAGLGLVTATFAIITIATMLGTVLLARAGFKFIPVKRLARYSHALAGAAICLCGAMILFMGV